MFDTRPIIDQLNGYTGDNPWQDIITTLDGYDPAATARIDLSGASDRFVVGGWVIRHDHQTGQWYETGDFVGDDTAVTVADLTARLGLPEDEQHIVLAWANARLGDTWTEREATHLVAEWVEDHPPATVPAA